MNRWQRDRDTLWQSILATFFDFASQFLYLLLNLFLWGQSGHRFDHSFPNQILDGRNCGINGWHVAQRRDYFVEKECDSQFSQIRITKRCDQSFRKVQWFGDVYQIDLNATAKTRSLITGRRMCSNDLRINDSDAAAEPEDAGHTVDRNEYIPVLFSQFLIPLEEAELFELLIESQFSVLFLWWAESSIHSMKIEWTR